MISKIIKELKLQPHPEGGYYRETYRSKILVGEDYLANEMKGSRACCTSIYYLLEKDDYSAFHRIKQDEIWHFYLGSDIKLHYIDKKGKYGMLLLGTNFYNGSSPQIIIPAGYWFAAELSNKESFALVGCTVAPGFSFEDFELANGDALAKQYPEHKVIIEQLTRK